MKRFLARASIAVLFVISITISGITSAFASDDPTLVSLGPGQVTGVRTDGNLVVWGELVGTQPDNSENNGIYAARLSDHQQFKVSGPTSGLLMPMLPDVSGNLVVWNEFGACPDRPLCYQSIIRGKDFTTGRKFVPSDMSPGNLWHVGAAISGSTVVWAGVALDNNGKTMSETILGRDVGSMSAPFTIAEPVTSTKPTYSLPVIDGNRVAWAQNDDNGWRAELYYLGSHTPPSAFAQGTGHLNGLDISGDTMAYSYTDPDNNSFLVVSNMETGKGRILPAGPAEYVDMDGQYVFWTSRSSSSANTEIHGYDLVSDISFLVDSGIMSSGNYPWASGGAIAWQKMTRGQPIQNEVHAARVADVLPNARRADPGFSDRNHAYFPETGHTIMLGFKSFWDRSGGLSVFGFPLTEEFEENGSDPGQRFTVQYFERQMFEYHPENAGTPYEVLLSRLGAADAEQRGLLNSPSFQPLSAAPGSGGTLFFTETGHSLSSGFRSYWERNGLEFGDPGTSYRESLALFGYPISEEFLDPSTGLVTQYFERAVFEYHPDNSDPYKVELRRLGADLLENRSW